MLINYISNSSHSGEQDETLHHTGGHTQRASVHINDLLRPPLPPDLKVTHRRLLSSASAGDQCGLPAEFCSIIKLHNNFPGTRIDTPC